MREFEIFLWPNKKHKVAVFVLKNDKEFRSFVSEVFPELKYEDNGACFFLPMDDSNKTQWMGALCFNEQYLSVFSVVHESIHAILSYIKYLKKCKIFTSEIDEERFVYLTELLTKKLCKKLKIKKVSIPNENFMNEEFKYFAKEIGFWT